MNQLKRHMPSPAMIVALVALFVALGGAAYAGVTLSNNSVKSATIKNGEVKTADLANSAVTNLKLKNNSVNSAKVKNGSLETADLSAAAQTALKGAAGPTGPAGATAGFAVRAVDVLAFVTSTDQTLATLPLPAGNYVITAKVVINNNEAALRQYGCSLRLGATVIDSFFDALELDADGSAAADDRDVVTLTSAGTLAAPGAATVVCQTNSASGNWLARTITAVQVATLTGP